MRTKALICAATLLAAGVATSMAQNVYSLNVVGYVTKTVKSGGKLACFASPLTTTNNTIGGVINTATVPSGSVLFKWNNAGNTFVTYTRTPVGWNPTTATSVALVPGEGFFLKSPTSSTSDITNVFVGEVLQSFSPNTTGSISNYLGSGLWLAGNSVPQSNGVTGMGLVIPFSSSPVNQIFKWNETTQAYVISTKTPAGWNPAAEPGFDVGEGFFTKLVSSQSWLQNFTVQ